MTVAVVPIQQGVHLADEIDILERREHAIRLRHEGLTYRDIAKRLNVSIDTVQADFRALRTDWLRRIARNRAVWMSEILADVMALRAMAIEGYLRSIKPSMEKSVETSEKAGEKRRVRKKTKNYDPRFLSIALDCDKQRMAILGFGDKALVDRVDEMTGKKRPKLLVIRDRQPASDLLDITRLLEVECAEPVQDGEVVDGAVPFPEPSE